MKCGKPAYAFKKYAYETEDWSEIAPVELEITLFNPDMNIDQLLEEFQRFMLASGYFFYDNQRLGVITDE